MDETKSIPFEKLNSDNLDCPVDVINHKIIQTMDLPFQVYSTGKYREGKQYSYYREGIDGYCFFLTTQGRGEITYRGRTMGLSACDVIFCSSTIPAQNRSLDDEWSFSFVNIRGNYCKSYEQMWNNNGLYVIHVKNIEYYQNIIDHISSCINQPYLSDELDINADITQLLTSALNEKYTLTEKYHRKLYPNWVVESANLLSKVSENNISISELASKYFMEKNNFIRRFKHYIGHSPKEYQMICRLEAAANLLHEQELSVLEVAVKTGFASPSFFSNAFKKKYGVTPTEYRSNKYKS